MCAFAHDYFILIDFSFLKGRNVFRTLIKL